MSIKIGKNNNGDFEINVDGDPVTFGGSGDSGDSYRTAYGTDADAVVNGAALKAAYTAAKVLTPNGAPLSSINRASVLVYPGRYDMAAGSHESGLTLDAEFVDLVGIGLQKGIVLTSAGRTVVQTANNVQFKCLTLESTSSASRVFDSSDDAAYFPETDLPRVKMEDVVFNGVDNAWSTRNDIVFSGTYVDCVAGSNSFGNNGTFKGKATNCAAGASSFGAYGTCSGTITNCVAGSYSFGGMGVLSGKLYSCRMTSGNFPYVSGGGITRNCLTGSNVANNQG